MQSNYLWKAIKGRAAFLFLKITYLEYIFLYSYLV